VHGKPSIETKLAITKADAKAEQQLGSGNIHIVQAPLLMPFSLVLLHFITLSFLTPPDFVTQYPADYAWQKMRSFSGSVEQRAHRQISLG
jgi:hypothetical protein